MDQVSSLLPKIPELEIQGFDSSDQDSNDFLWEQLASTNFPVLECLTLKPSDWDEPPFFHYLPHSTVRITRKFLQALQKFRESLKELGLLFTLTVAQDLIVESFELVPGVMEPLEKLEKLRIHEYSTTPYNDRSWHLFGKLFVNLQKLEVKKPQDDMERRFPRVYLERFWRMFPRLKGISLPKPRPKLEDLWTSGDDGLFSFQSKPVGENNEDEEGDGEYSLEEDEEEESEIESEDEAVDYHP